VPGSPSRDVHYDARMSRDPSPAPVMTFPTLDDAEGALDWIGLAFHEVDGAFEGELDEDDAERLEAAWAADDTPQAVRALAAILREHWRDASAPRAWRVSFRD
jgi:hypothetical protein